MLETLEDDGYVDPKKLTALITDKTKLIIFNAFTNPIGTYHDANKQRQIAEALAKAHSAFPQFKIMLDNIYQALLYRHSHQCLFPFRPDFA